MTEGTVDPPEGSCQTFQIPNEGHTLGNSLRYILNKNPDVALAACSRPHPSNDFINVRIQTTGQVTAVEALGSACDDLARVCDHMESAFLAALEQFKAQENTEASRDDSEMQTTS